MDKRRSSEVIGNMGCPICGHVSPVKRSARGRLSMVCRWQDDGCGSQLQALTVDAAMMMKKKITLIDSGASGVSSPVEVVNDDLKGGEKQKHNVDGGLWSLI